MMGKFEEVFPVLTYRRMLYTAASLLSTAIIVALILFCYSAFLQFRDQQISNFNNQTGQIQTEVDRLSAQTTQFSEMSSRLQKAYGTFYFPFDLKQIKPDAVSTIAPGDLSVVPLSLLVDGDVLKGDLPLERLFLMLGQASALPMFHHKEGFILDGFLYTSDHRLFASYPAMDVSEQERANKMGAKDYIDLRSKIVDKALNDVATVKSDARGNKFVWFSFPEYEGSKGRAITRLAVRICLAPDYFATIVFSVKKEQFEKVFLRNGDRSRLFVTTNGPSSDVLMRPVGVNDRSFDQEIRKVITRYEKQLGTSYFYDERKFFLVSHLDGPNWNVVYTFSYGDIIRNMPIDFIGGIIFGMLSLLLIWISTWYFDKFVFGPSQRNALALAESRQFSQSIVETLPVGVVVYDPLSACSVLKNSMAARMMAACHLSARDLHRHLAGQREVGSPDCLSLHSESMFVAEIVLPGGGINHLGLVCSQARFSGRKVLLFGMVDMNMQKEHEALLEEAKSAADQANQAKSMFLAQLSHEIRTPLHGAIGHLELLSKEALGTSPRERVRLIRSAFHRLMGLVNDVLDVTKIESNELGIVKTALNVNDLLEDVAHLFAPLAAEKRLEFHCLFDPELELALSGDANRLMQVFQNLVGNALKFTESGSVTLSSRLLRKLNGVAWVRFEVADSGIGISPMAQQHIFKPLKQADDSINQRFGGTGLGLFLCYRLAHLMGGRTTLYSEVGQGSIFGFEIPMEVIVAREKGPTPKPLAGRVVDIRCDMPEHHRMLRDFLVMWGAMLWDRSQVCPPDVRLIFQNGFFEQGMGSIEGLDVRTVVLSEASERRREEPKYMFRVSPYSRKGWCDALGSRTKEETEGFDERIDLNVPDACSLDILVVEDDLVNLLLIEHQLKELGCTNVRVSKNAEAALISWKERPPDLLITDLGLPGMDGVALAKEVVREHPGALIVANTAANAIGNANASLFFDVLCKPVVLKDLSRVIEAVLLRKRPLSAGLATQERQADISQEFAAVLAAAFVDTWSMEEGRLLGALGKSSPDAVRRALHRIQGGLKALGEAELAAQSLDLQDALEFSNEDNFPDEKERCIVWLKHVNGLVDRLRRLQNL